MAIVGVLAALTLVAVSGAHARRVATVAAQPHPSIFSVNTATVDRNHSNYKKDFARARKLGARWVHFNGENVHWRNGKPDYSVLDNSVKLARGHGLGVLISLGGDPKACSVHPRPSDPTVCPPTTHADLQTYDKFLKQELLRYSSEVTYFESWVEPNEPQKWAPKPSPTQYAALLKAQYAVVQSVNETHGLHLKLLFGGPTNFSIAPPTGGSTAIAVLPFTHAVLTALAGQKPFDGIAVHAYRFPPATRQPTFASFDDIKGLPAASGHTGPYPAQGCNNTGNYCKMTWPEELSAYEQEFVNHYGSQLPMWLTEFGWPGSKTVPPHQPADDYPSYGAQKQDVKHAYNDLLRMSFVQAAFWYNLRDYQAGAPSSAPLFFGHYGLLQYNASAKPAGSAFKALAHAHPGS